MAEPGFSMAPLRPLGGTGLQVSAIGLGMAALGRPGYLTLGHESDLPANRDVRSMCGHAKTVLDAAWAGGVRYVDAARSYGRAEQFLASWLRSRGLRPTVGSKWGYRYTADWQVDADVHEVKDHSLGHLDAQLAESREVLDGCLDLYQIHSATLASGVLRDTRVLARLADLRATGVAIGLTTSGPEQARVIREAVETRLDGVRLFDTVQSTWNLLEPSAGPALAEAADRGVAVIIKEALANGRLAGRDPHVNARLRADRGLGVDAVAIAAALAQPWVTVVLSGAASADQLTSNLRALTPAAREAAAGVVTRPEPAQTYWARRSTLPWT